MMRGEAAPEIAPKAGLSFVVFGAFIFTLLNALKTSARICRVVRFDTGNILKAERSVETYLGPKSISKGAFPYGVPGGGTENASGLKNAAAVSTLLRPPGKCGFPTTSGRSLLLPSK